MNTTEFSVSKSEVTRRTNAYTALIISFFLNFVLLNYIFIKEIQTAKSAIIIIYSVLSLLLILSRISLTKFFKSFLKTKITFTDSELKRKTVKQNEVYLFKDIKKILIKNTTRKTIRSITITLKSNQKITLNGMDDFDKLKDNLLNGIDDKVEVKTITEPMDFDHWLFYPVLGFLIATLFVSGVKSALLLSTNNLKTVYDIFSIYLLILGTYFLIAKPLKRAYGNKSEMSDYIFAFGMIIAGVIIFLL